MASLRLEYCYSKENLLLSGCVSKSIYFIFEGKVDVYMVDKLTPFMYLDEGCYYGDISLIFNLRNYLWYQSKRETNGKYASIFSVDKVVIDEMFKRYPDFKKVMEIRALKRQHYFKRSMNDYYNIDEEKT